MDRRFLERCLAEDLSLEEIGRRVHRHPSTVSYWLDKYGLRAVGRQRHAARGALKRDELEALVGQGLTLAAIAQRLDRSVPTIRYWLQRYGLKTANRRGRKPIVPPDQVRKAIEGGRRELTANCPQHGEGIFVIEKSGRARCRQCRMDRVAERRRKVKRILLEEAGGRCSRCGYDRFVGALHFHHLDASQKSFGLAEKGATIAIATVRAEAAKCIVLCANCHAEVEHGGEASLKCEPRSGG